MDDAMARKVFIGFYAGRGMITIENQVALTTCHLFFKNATDFLLKDDAKKMQARSEQIPGVDPGNLTYGRFLRELCVVIAHTPFQKLRAADSIAVFLALQMII